MHALGRKVCALGHKVNAIREQVVGDRIEGISGYAESGPQQEVPRRGQIVQSYVQKVTYLSVFDARIGKETRAIGVACLHYLPILVNIPAQYPRIFVQYPRIF